MWLYLIGIIPALALIVAVVAPIVFALDIVPATRDQARGLSFALWVLYGNDDGGLYGEGDTNWVAAGNTARTFWTALRWWMRNPCHNLMFYVLNWPREIAVVLFEYPPARCLIQREHRNWVVEFENVGQVQIVWKPLFFSWRCFALEGYLGWRDGGVLGAALRRFR